jgi:hypothetical protein
MQSRTVRSRVAVVNAARRAARDRIMKEAYAIAPAAGTDPLLRGELGPLSGLRAKAQVNCEYL